MESLVYEDSPLADYLEGEGEGDREWIPTQIDTQNEPNPAPNFAPQGIATFQDRIREKLPKPLDAEFPRRVGIIGKVCKAFSVVLSSRIGRSDNERFLEQFGYVIVASRLLDENNAPSYHSAAGALSSAPTAEQAPFSTTFGLKGAAVTAMTSFSIAWLIHWSRSPNGSGFSLYRIVALLVLLPAVGAIFYAFAKRQWLKYVRYQAVEAAAAFIGNAQGFDSAASASLVFIQEVELVSRGYRISTPLSPISRLEEGAQVRRCMRLRHTASECLSSLLDRYLQAQHTLRLLADTASLEKYYDIYDISTEDLRKAGSALSELGLEDKHSLRSLRTLFGKLYTVRKSILCCLLALSADGGDSDITTWSSTIEEMRDLGVITGRNITKMTRILSEQDRDIAPLPAITSTCHNRDSLRAQFRRLNTLLQGIRALHAKMHVIREESEPPFDHDICEQGFTANFMTQYESIGSDIRELLQEWEAGKCALMSNPDKVDAPDRLLHSPSGLISPLSPTFSLGGVTVVDESPAAALRVLNGENHPYSTPDSDMGDEEIFEAVTLPSRKRNSMTREERIARVKEDRVRQAAAREKAEANTSMLRELETVIKLRPQANRGQRVTSI